MAVGFLEPLFDTHTLLTPEPHRPGTCRRGKAEASASLLRGARPAYERFHLASEGDMLQAHRIILPRRHEEPLAVRSPGYEHLESKRRLG